MAAPAGCLRDARRAHRARHLARRRGIAFGALLCSAQIATSTLLWVVLPLTAGIARTRRREVR
jgi:hypothetical protein